MTAYDQRGQLLGQVQEDAQRTQRLGIETDVPEGIAKVVIDYDSDLFDEAVYQIFLE